MPFLHSEAVTRIHIRSAFEYALRHAARDFARTRHVGLRDVQAAILDRAMGVAGRHRTEFTGVYDLNWGRPNGDQKSEFGA